MVHFDSVHLINLERRPDRLASFWRRFPCSWPFKNPRRVEALDGLKIPPPAWYKQQAGAWGCLQSHLRLYEDALNHGHDLFIFEDDCVFAADFADRVGPFFAAVPDDWQMIYLGGLHRSPDLHGPRPVNDHVHLARAVTTTYAYGVRHEFLKVLYPALLEAEPHHIDQMLARLMLAHAWRVYCPVPWLVGMDAGPSDICGRYYQVPHFWEYSERTKSEPIHLLQLLHKVVWHADGPQEDVPLAAPQCRPRLTSTIGGWFSPECGQVYRRVCRLQAASRPGRVCRLVEVGSWRGRSLSYLADLIGTGEVRVTAVDTWQGNADAKDPTHGQDVYEDFQDNMRRLKIHDLVTVCRRPSVEAAEGFDDGSLDAVLIDADHRREAVAADLAAWWPKVKAGGVLLGHDYSPDCACPGVVAAVNEFAAVHRLCLHTEADLWLIHKPDNYGATLSRQCWHLKNDMASAGAAS